MASLAQTGVAGRLASHRSASTSAALAACPARRRHQPQRASVVSRSALETVAAVSQLVSTAAVFAGAYMLLNRAGPIPEQDNYEQGSQQECPVCSGTGFEACLCQRWSDGDVGCSSCSKTGYMRCRNCGGGGRATPLLVRVRKGDSSRGGLQ